MAKKKVMHLYGPTDPKEPGYRIAFDPDEKNFHVTQVGEDGVEEDKDTHASYREAKDHVDAHEKEVDRQKRLNLKLTVMVATVPREKARPVFTDHLCTGVNKGTRALNLSPRPRGSYGDPDIYPAIPNVVRLVQRHYALQQQAEILEELLDTVALKGLDYGQKYMENPGQWLMEPYKKKRATAEKLPDPDTAIAQGMERLKQDAEEFKKQVKKQRPWE